MGSEPRRSAARPVRRLRVPLLALVLASLLGTPSGAMAQSRRPRGAAPALWGGLRAGRDFENHAWSAGGQLGLQLQDRFEIRPSGDYFFGDRTPFRWQLNADGVLAFGPGRAVYGGGGAAFTRVRPLSAVKTGYNLFFGLALAPPTAPGRAFAEFRWTFVNQTSPFRLVLGVSRRLSP